MSSIRVFRYLMVVLIADAVASAALGQTQESIVAWGLNDQGQTTLLASHTDSTAVSGGILHSLGLKSDGAIVAWGYNNVGQCNVPSPNNGFVACAAGAYHNLGLNSDGAIVAWGDNTDGQCNVPTPNMGYLAISAGGYHSLVLKPDGSVEAWGNNVAGQCDVPAPNTDFVAIAAGAYFSLGLKSNGLIIAWGNNNQGQCNVLAPNMNFVAIAAGAYHGLGIKSDGSIAAWGDNTAGQCNVPAPNTGFLVVSAGVHHTIGLKPDRSIVVWGNNTYGQYAVPAPNTRFAAISAGGHHNLAIQVTHCPRIDAQPSDQSVPGDGVARFSVAASGTPPFSYQWRRGTTPLADSGNFSGATSATLTIAPAAPGDAGTDYNVVVANACGEKISTNAALVVVSCPSIDTPPADQTVPRGAVASLSVVAIGSEPLSYQWRRGTTLLLDGGAISGAVTATLTIDPVTRDDEAADYNVVVSNACGNQISNNVALTVASDALFSNQIVPCGGGLCGAGVGIAPLALMGLSVHRKRLRR